jgi:hypothetical protein
VTGVMPGKVNGNPGAIVVAVVVGVIVVGGNGPGPSGSTTVVDGVVETPGIPEDGVGNVGDVGDVVSVVVDVVVGVVSAVVSVVLVVRGRSSTLVRGTQV